MNVGIIGLGLIGGSMAKSVKARTSHTVWGFDTDAETMTLARLCGAIDGALTEENLPQCDLILVAVCPGAAVEWVASHAEHIAQTAIVVDLCGVKRAVVEQIAPIAAQRGFAYIGGHPMAGSEKTGYENAKTHLIENAYYIITPGTGVPEDTVNEFVALVSSLKALPLVLDYRQHDFITACVSHLPHLIASSLVELVKDLDGPDELMKRIAAGGFKDITRIASSSPDMWEQICMTNSENILKALDHYQAQLSRLRTEITGKEADKIHSFFAASRDYRNSIPEASAGPLKKTYAFYCDMVDEAGGIATLATILASGGISIKNIGIIHNREFEEAVLRVELYEEDAYKKAVELLRKYRYTIYER